MSLLQPVFTHDRAGCRHVKLNQEFHPAMTTSQPNNPLHGQTLEMILNYLVDAYGWKELGSRITINCFNENPSIKSSLTFLRRTPWARKKVEDLYIATID
jgi:uncharacterized protein (DUF2132 family)